MGITRYRVDRKVQVKVEKIYISILVGLLAVWSICLGFRLELNCIALDRNASRIESDTSKIKVSHINKDNKIYLDDTTDIDGDSVSEYAHVPEGVGTYVTYVDGKTVMTVEVSSSELFAMGGLFLMVEWVLFLILFILFCIRYYHGWVLWLLIVSNTILAFIIYSYWFEVAKFSKAYYNIVVALVIGRLVLCGIISAVRCIRSRKK